MKNKILLHTCCAPCAAYVCEVLRNFGYEVVLYFYNPNIHPKEEYFKRLDELKMFAEKNLLELHVEEYFPEHWFEVVKGLDAEKEGGKRCEVCFKMRLLKTANKAKELSINSFGTVMSISPHKNSLVINKIGKEIQEKTGVAFLEKDFKKKDGFKKSLELSKEYGFYRQNYCGCLFSQRK